MADAEVRGLCARIENANGILSLRLDSNPETRDMGDAILGGVSTKEIAGALVLAATELYALIDEEVAS